MRSGDLEAEMLDHVIEVAALMEQSMAAFDAARSDDEIRHRTNGDPQPSKTAVVRRRLHSEIDVEHALGLEGQEQPFDPSRQFLVSGASKDFDEHDVAHEDL